MIPQSVQSKIGRGLHRNPKHPLGLVTQKIEDFFSSRGFVIHHMLNPRVSTQANFDDLLIPKDHPSRSPSDTFYLDENTVLRTHTSAHQTALLREGNRSFIAFGDCYRRDTVDCSHYPVFHQVEGVHLCENPEEDLKSTLEELINHIFSDVQIKWADDQFPFTHPSWEMEICLPGSERWLEILGCGIIQPRILENCGLKGQTGWAFGVGLERLAMTLYAIPDIRLFWTDDPRFHQQFRQGDAAFVPYSKHPPVYKDISFWVREDYHPHHFHELARETGGDLVESVEQTDSFVHPKTGKTSNTFRITYRSSERSLTNEEINGIQDTLRTRAETQLKLQLR